MQGNDWIYARFTPDGRRVLAWTPSARIYVWAFPRGVESREANRQYFYLHGVALSPCGRRYAVEVTAGCPEVRDLRTGNQISAGPLFCGNTRGVAFSPCGKFIVGGCGGGRPVVWEAATGRELFTLPGSFFFTQCSRFSPDGQSICVSSSTGRINVYSNRGEPQAEARADVTALDLAYSPDGKAIAFADIEGVTVRDARTLEKILMYRPDESKVTDLSWSPDGSLLAIAGHSPDMVVYDYRRRRVARRVPHPDYLTTVHFSPDGKFILTGCRDRFARIWDAATGEAVASPRRRPERRYPRHVQALARKAMRGDRGAGRTLAFALADHPECPAPWGHQLIEGGVAPASYVAG